MIPVDVRRHKGVADSISNLSLPIFLHVNPEQSWQELKAALMTLLSQNSELAKERFEKSALLMPGLLLKKYMLYVLKKSSRTGKYPMSGIISDIGVLDLNKLSTNGFEALNVILLPIFAPLAPICINICHHSGGTRIALNIKQGLAIRDICEDLRNYILKQNQTARNDQQDDQLKEERPFMVSLRRLWAEHLNLQDTNMDINATFHQLGGDSVGLMLLISEVSDLFIERNKSTFISTVFNKSAGISIHSLAKIIEDHK
jgi:hypothetical protein